MKFNFLPKEDSFFQEFQRQASFAKEAGAMLLNLMQDFDNMGAHLEALNELERQGDHVVQIHRLHDGGDIMVAVGALAEHLERQIDFGGRLDLNFHFSVPQETLGSSRARFSGA